ncbi:hypothetical protein NT01EI_2809 [Edwardsiella ictaluri 93-146]|uniref:Uncharacterized protein n=1 Tax=Edwardsiella ictaluri (strain 93-146) TaxID=634503 RepID=C5BEH6_EDWI9|nr:hypothetical protein NT01EI_2809 [Edwardsiella ictaluri 93-146]
MSGFFSLIFINSWLTAGVPLWVHHFTSYLSFFFVIVILRITYFLYLS